MVEIGLHTPEGGIFQKDIAARQELSNKYLDHIIHALKVAGLIRRNGHRGGYVLAKEPATITMFDINNAFEPGICIIDCLDCMIKCPKELECCTKDFWLLLNSTIIDIFRSHTLQDLMDRYNHNDKSSSSDPKFC